MCPYSKPFQELQCIHAHSHFECIAKIQKKKTIGSQRSNGIEIVLRNKNICIETHQSLAPPAVPTVQVCLHTAGAHELKCRLAVPMDVRQTEHVFVDTLIGYSLTTAWSWMRLKGFIS